MVTKRNLRGEFKCWGIEQQQQSNGYQGDQPLHGQEQRWCGVGQVVIRKSGGGYVGAEPATAAEVGWVGDVLNGSDITTILPRTSPPWSELSSRQNLPPSSLSPAVQSVGWEDRSVGGQAR